MRQASLSTRLLRETGSGTTERLHEGILIIPFLFSKAKINGTPWERIYHFHIRKTGGTSLNHAFLEWGGGDAEARYSSLVSSPGNRCKDKNLDFVGWNKKGLERGAYLYGFSHEPFHQIKLPPRTFTLTCFRDPLERLLSHYRMLREYKRDGVNHPCMQTEGVWVQEPGGFEEFLNQIPPEHRMRQLYMFSKTFDPHEALANAKKINLIFSTKSLQAGVDKINLIFGTNLRVSHRRATLYEERLEEKAKTRAMELLHKEYEFLARVAELPPQP